MESYCRCLDDYAHCDTITRHTALKRGLLRVEYSLHPYYGQDAYITSLFEKSGQRIARCHEVGASAGVNGFEVPWWMFDKAYCASQEITDTAYVPVETLMALSVLLEGYMSRQRVIDFKDGVDESDDPTLINSRAGGKAASCGGASSTGPVRESGAVGTLGKSSAGEPGTGRRACRQVAVAKPAADIGKEGV